jgi:hypothetical protein
MDRPGWRAWLDRVLLVGFVLGAAFLVFTGGMAVAVFRVPPYPWMADAYQAAQSMTRWVGLRSQQHSPVIWKKDREQGSGLVEHQPAQSFDGYTLFSSGHATSPVLLNMQGETVHRWDISFREVWPDPPHISAPSPKRQIYLRRAHVFPNGELLACFVSASDTPYGYGLARFDASSELLWRYDAHTHHDFDVGPDGTIHALTHRVRDAAPERLSALASRVAEDFIVTLTPQGKVKQKVSILDAMLNSKYSDALKRRLTQDKDEWDLLHTNSINRIGPAFAAAHEGLEPGQVLVLVRNLNLLAAVDLDEQAVTWGMTGPWHLPHDPQMLDNGHMTLFDNQALHGAMRGSRVIEFDPADSQIVWQYRGSEETPFFSSAFSRQQVLPNDNVLIVEAHGGRVFEVNQAGEIVWSYVNPVRAGQDEELIPVVTDAVRYPREALPFVEQMKAGGEVQSARGQAVRSSTR